MTMADNHSLGTHNGPANGSHFQLEVEFYTVVWSGFLLILVVLLGVLPNLALLVATRCKRQIRTWRYGLIYSACAINIFFSLTWIPLNFCIVVMSYMQEGSHFIACYAHVALFHFCVAGLVVTTIFMGIQRLSAIWSETYEKKTSDAFVIVAVAMSWVVGGLCAFYAGVYHSSTYSYAVCMDPTNALIGSTEDATHHSDYHWAETVLCLVYVAALTSTLVVFLVLSFCRKQSLDNHCQTRTSRNYNYHGIPTIHGKLEDDDKMVGSTISQQSPTKSSIRDISEAKKSAGNLSSISKKVCLQEPTADDIHNISDVDDDDDDDAFDLKMRLKVAKRSSGRRHTVANIGHSEAGFKGRRGSMDDHRMGAHPANYQYVRKWSVDIVALQDQLENPKLHPMPLRELVELREKNKKTADAAKEAAPLKEKHADRSNSDHDERSVKVKEKDLKVITEQIVEETEAPLRVSCAEDPISTSSVEVPAITVNLENHSSPPDEVAVQTYGDTRDDADTDNKEYRAKIRRRLVSVWKSTILMLVITVCLLPMCVLLTMADHRISEKYVLMGLMVLQCPVYAALLVWIDTSLGHALRRLRLKMTSLRCVCYCHVGKRRRCFGKNSSECC